MSEPVDVASPTALTDGCLVLVVGPSGAGKDTLIDAVAEHFEDDKRIRTVQRIITRPAGAGGEEHRAVDRATFESLSARGEFAVQWEAHGLAYAIPVSALDAVRGGAIVIVNASRTAIRMCFDVFPRCHVVHVYVPAAVLSTRLERRGRELSDDIRRRLERRVEIDVPPAALSCIDNSDELELAIEQFVAIVDRQRQPIAGSQTSV